MKAYEILNKGEEIHGRLHVRVEASEIKNLIVKLKENGFNHFVMLSCIDWLDANEFELVYHLWSYEYKEHVMLFLRLPRENPKIESLHDIFPQIETYEREIHELYGVYFEGNKRLKPLFLEGWRDIPPMRKDFDSKKFVKDVYEKIPEVEEDENEGI